MVDALLVIKEDIYIQIILGIIPVLHGLVLSGQILASILALITCPKCNIKLEEEHCKLKCPKLAIQETVKMVS